jgi:hypothetical protein
VVPQFADIAPGHLVRCDTEVIVAEGLNSSKHGVDLSLFGNKTASTSSFYLMLLFGVLALIFGAPPIKLAGR